MDFQFTEETVARAKFKNKGMTLNKDGTYVFLGWQDGVYEDYWSGPDKDIIGSIFAPVKHNYLYGWKMTPVIKSIQRQMNESKPLQKVVYETWAKMDKLVGGHDTLPQVIKHLALGEGTSILL